MSHKIAKPKPAVAARDNSPARKTKEKKPHVLVIGLGEEGCHTTTAKKPSMKLT